MSKVLLIAPPFYRLLGSHYNGLHLGIAYIAAVLQQHGHDAMVYNADYLDTCRQKRNRVEYDYAGGVAEGEADELVAFVRELRETTLNWIASKHPELLP